MAALPETLAATTFKLSTKVFVTRASIALFANVLLKYLLVDPSDKLSVSKEDKETVGVNVPRPSLYVQDNPVPF